MAYRIEYSPATLRHLRRLSARQQTLVLDRVDELLVHEPAVETRNRNPLRPNDLATWELRIGSLRVYYDVLAEPAALVVIVAVGVEDGSRVRIGGEVIDL